MKDTKVTSFNDMLKQVFDGSRECLHAPDSPVEAGEVVLGILEDPIARSMFSFRQELINSHKKFIQSLPAEMPEDKTVCKQLESTSHQHENRQKCVSCLFWESVYSTFPKSRDPKVAIGIREGWQVVIFKSHRSGFFDILMGNQE